MVFGASAGAVLVIGLLRVFFFEKGAAFYFTNIPFLAKLALFALIGLLSIRPTREFLSWRSAIKVGEAPTVDPGTLRQLRKRSEARRVGKDCVSTCRSRWSPYH